ncbi:MAG TPA: hypothetical protein VGC17_01755 [Lactovum miscens]
MNEELAIIEETAQEVVSKGLSIDIMEIKPTVADEIVDMREGRCPPSFN